MEDYKENNITISNIGQGSQESTSMDRSNNKQIEDIEYNIILYLLENPKKNVKHFFKNDIAAYEGFRKKYSVKEIYKKVKKILAKKQQAQLMQVQKELEKQGKDEASGIVKFFNTATETLTTTIAYIKDQPLNYRYTSDAVKSQIEIMKFLLDLKKSEQASDIEDNMAYKIMVERIEEFMEFSRNPS